MEASPKQIKARNWLISLFSIFVIIDVFATVTAKDFLLGGVRFILTIALMYSVLAGFNWAKWLSVVLFCVGGALAFVFFIQQVVYQASVFSAAFLSVGLLCFFIAAFLVFGKTINSYFSYRRDLRNL